MLVPSVTRGPVTESTLLSELTVDQQKRCVQLARNVLKLKTEGSLDLPRRLIGTMHAHFPALLEEFTGPLTENDFDFREREHFQCQCPIPDTSFCRCQPRFVLHLFVYRAHQNIEWIRDQRELIDFQREVGVQGLHIGEFIDAKMIFNRMKEATFHQLILALRCPDGVAGDYPMYAMAALLDMKRDLFIRKICPPTLQQLAFEKIVATVTAGFGAKISFNEMPPESLLKDLQEKINEDIWAYWPERRADAPFLADYFLSLGDSLRSAYWNTSELQPDGTKLYHYRHWFRTRFFKETNRTAAAFKTYSGLCNHAMKTSDPVHYRETLYETRKMVTSVKPTAQLAEALCAARR